MHSATAVTVGSFDGVHLGHRRLVQAARNAAGPGGRVVVLAFDPNPLTRLKPESAPARLTTFSDRADLLRAAGADDVVRLVPTDDLLRLSPRQFIHWLADEQAPAAIVEGPDFHFGHKRSGDVHTLRSFESQFNYRTHVIDPVEVVLSDHSIVRASSTLVRWLVSRGRVTDAERILGRPYELVGPVVPGDRRGRTLNMPTANIDHADLLVPMDAVYAGTALLPDGRTVPAAISIGTKPTFGSAARVCEAHLLDFDGPVDDYGWMLRLRFHSYLRDQLTFASASSLMDQMNRDLQDIQRSFLATVPA